MHQETYGPCAFAATLTEIRDCPRLIVSASHYRATGPCRCFETQETRAARRELADALVDLARVKQRVAELRRKVDTA